MSIIEFIEDEAFRNEITRLNLTVPDSRSVLSPEIEDYHPQLYYRLVAMEAYTYQRSQQDAEAMGGGAAGFDQYEEYWSTYNASLMSYVSHAPISKQTLKDFFIGFFCFISVHLGRDMGDPDLIPRCNAKTLFNMGGYYDTVQTWPLEYFDDFIAGDPMALPEPSEDSAERLTAEPDVVGTLWDTDASKVTALTATFADTVSDAGMQAAFSNPSEPKGSLSPTEMWDLVFEELNWMWYVDTFGSDVKIPERPS